VPLDMARRAVKYMLLAADANQTFYSSSPEDGDPVPTPPVMRTINAAGYW
jgi:hypothetical protein